MFLDCVFTIWFTQCGCVWFTLAVPCPCHAPTLPCFSRNGIERLSRDSLWAACPACGSFRLPRDVPRRLSEAGGQCETKHRSSWTRKRAAAAARYKKDNLLSRCTSSSDISGYHVDFHEGHGTIGACWARHGTWELMHSMAGERHGWGMGTACCMWIGLKESNRCQWPWLSYCHSPQVEVRYSFLDWFPERHHYSQLP
jgi:hypothetical protein